MIFYKKQKIILKKTQLLLIKEKKEFWYIIRQCYPELIDHNNLTYDEKKDEITIIEQVIFK